MSLRVCIAADSIGYPTGGGHLWVYLNWALGLRSLGCEVIWLEFISGKKSAPTIRTQVDALRQRLGRYGFADHLAISARGNDQAHDGVGDCLDLDAAAEADLLLNLRYATRADVVQRFGRSALVDIDPGLLQIWISQGKAYMAPHDTYLTTGETVGAANSRIPDLGLPWQHTRPCVALDHWPVHDAPEDAPFTTVTHWDNDEYIEHDEQLYRNDKRSGFQPFLDLPQRTDQRLELAVCLGRDEQHERSSLEDSGWTVRDSQAAAGTPWDYQRYVQSSRGEFSCAKPSCVHLANAWVSDRTLCYLASGKPAVVQHTGPSSLLPDAQCLFRFRDLEEAARHLSEAASDYERHCREARALAEEHFDARKVVKHVLERAMT